VAYSITLTATPLTHSTILATIVSPYTETVTDFVFSGGVVLGWELLAVNRYVVNVEFMLPSTSYNLEVITVGSDDDDTFVTAGPDYEAWPLPFSKKLLESFLFAVSKELQYIGGSPATVLARNYTSGQYGFLVKSTLGFSQSGSLWVGNDLWYYTGKTVTSFFGLTTEYPFVNIPAGTAIRPNISGILPNNYTPGIINTTVYP
jgi:hypothetical protein